MEAAKAKAVLDEKFEELDNQRPLTETEKKFVENQKETELD